MKTCSLERWKWIICWQKLWYRERKINQFWQLFKKYVKFYDNHLPFAFFFNPNSGLFWLLAMRRTVSVKVVIKKFWLNWIVWLKLRNYFVTYLSIYCVSLTYAMHALSDPNLWTTGDRIEVLTVDDPLLNTEKSLFNIQSIEKIFSYLNFFCALF